MNIGVSVIICCYNSGWIIERCLSALIQQKVSQTLNWEIIIINNASIDNTVIIANNVLQSSNIDYSIIDETTPGLLSARKRGVKHAKYSYIIFCDDDNILCEKYVQTMYEIMQSDQSIGAYGGRGVAEFENTPDNIILKFISSYAIGSQKENISNKYLYGAGICVRRDVLLQVYKHHNFQLTGRCGKKLLAGDDSEMVKSIILKGYKIQCNDEIIFTHVLTAKRLTYQYLCNMMAGFGFSAPVLFVYDMCIKKQKFSIFYKYYILILIKTLIYLPFKSFRSINIRLIYLRNVIKGIHFWGVKSLRNIYSNFKQ